MNVITLPGSKSITNRDFILASLANWTSKLRGFLVSDDTKHMINALKQMGLDIESDWDEIIVEWWLNNIKGWDLELYIGQSWTCMRFLAAFILLSKQGPITLTGEERLLERPMGDLFDTIKQMWVRFESNGNLPPMKVFPSEITNNEVTMNGTSSSQFFTALLQIAPCLENGLTLHVKWDLVSKPYIDLTINEIRKFGVAITNHNYKSFEILPQKYQTVDMEIEWDASAMSYFCAHSILHGTNFKITNLWKESKQWDYKLLDKLDIFGLTYESDGVSTTFQSPWIENIDLEKFRDLEIDFEDMPDVSMTFMILSMFLPGKTYITWLQTLNLKECLRIDAMRDEIKKLGVEVTSDEKTITIWEFKWLPAPKPIDIETYNDHRIAMCFGVLETYTWWLKVLNPNCVAKTYPKFWEDLSKIKTN